MLHNLEQRSPEWHKFRETHIGSSDAVIIMGLGYITPLDLYNQKKGLTLPSFVTPAMQRGTDLEEHASAWYIEKTGTSVFPAVTTHAILEYLSSSLDGISFDGLHALELKCPGRAKLEEIKNNGVPAEYYCQIQHQYLVNPMLETMDLCVYQGDEHQVFPEKGIIFPIEKDEAYIKDMLPKLQEFHQCLITNTPPLATAKKGKTAYESCEDSRWDELADLLRESDLRLRLAKEENDALKQSIKDFSGGRNLRGAGLSIAYQSQKGSVDYNLIPELFNVDLEKYRKADIKKVVIDLD